MTLNTYFLKCRCEYSYPGRSRSLRNPAWNPTTTTQQVDLKFNWSEEPESPVPCMNILFLCARYGTPSSFLMQHHLLSRRARWAQSLNRCSTGKNITVLCLFWTSAFMCENNLLYYLFVLLCDVIKTHLLKVLNRGNVNKGLGKGQEYSSDLPFLFRKTWKI